MPIELRLWIESGRVHSGQANCSNALSNAIRETVDKQDDGNSVAVCAAHDTPAGNGLSPDFHESAHPFAIASPVVNYFHCVRIDE
jgi:hypothetical protein